MRKKKILLTGAAGFIGSYLLGYLNKKGYTDILIVDDFSDEDKGFNYVSKQFSGKIEREELDTRLKQNGGIDFIFHLGARTDTVEFDYTVHDKLNVQYSKMIWNYCADRNIPLVYASSAATYGAGELGYKDDHELVNRLQPLNPYGVSKNEFDKWALQQITAPPCWAGLKFFNVYGPNEYHKGRMASMVFHGFNQIKHTGKVKLFKSHRPDFRNGEQLRDFIFVQDVANVCCWLMENMIAGTWLKKKNGLYNLGTGKARSFNDLEKAVFKAMGKETAIEYIDMPEDIRNKYQYFTQANISKLRDAGFTQEFHSLEKGITAYVSNYLLPGCYY
jgi:ADP-L-glycero-D-manno-heptose 6-epimerase